MILAGPRLLLAWPGQGRDAPARLNPNGCAIVIARPRGTFATILERLA